MLRVLQRKALPRLVSGQSPGNARCAPRQVPSLMDGGALWFTDLTVADPTYALPVLTSLTFLATVELGAADGMQGQSADMLKNLKNFMRGLAVVMVPFTASLPAVRSPAPGA